MRGVVNDGNLMQLATQDRKVLQIVAVHVDTRVSKHAVLDVFALGVQNIQQFIGVHALRSGEYDDFKPLGYLVQELLQMRT